jgi:hypothetical protein
MFKDITGGIRYIDVPFPTLRTLKNIRERKDDFALTLLHFMRKGSINTSYESRLTFLVF